MHCIRRQISSCASKNSIRFITTRTSVDQWFETFQTLPKTVERERTIQSLRQSYKFGDVLPWNFFDGIFHRWVVEQPKQTALWINEKAEKISFQDVNDQSKRLGNVLDGKNFNLARGQSILVILPHESKEQLMMQLACLQNGWVFCPYDPQELKAHQIHHLIRLLAIDCVVTDETHFELLREFTHNPIRPLKKGLYIDPKISTPLPVGWNYLSPEANYAEKDGSKTKIPIPPTSPAIRFLSPQNQLVEYSRQNFFTHLLSAGLWLNHTKLPRLIWLNNDQQMISLAAWLLGSSIFHKPIENFSSMIDTFDHHPIDTLCTSSDKYKLLDRSVDSKISCNLEQLFSVQSIDPVVKKRWYSLTQLDIRDDYRVNVFEADGHDPTEVKASHRAG